MLYLFPATVQAAAAGGKKMCAHKTGKSSIIIYAVNTLTCLTCPIVTLFKELHSVNYSIVAV